MWIGERERFIKPQRVAHAASGGGASPPDLDPEIAAETLGALTEQIAYIKIGLAAEKPSDAEIERLGSHCATIWYRGVFGRGRSRLAGATLRVREEESCRSDRSARCVAVHGTA